MSLVATVTSPGPDLASLLSAEDLPIEDLQEAGRVFVRFAEGSGDIVGIGGYEPLGHAVLLRSIVVVPERRGKGLAGRIAEELMRRAAEGGATEAYALTSGSKTFLSGIGFERIDRGAAPAAVLETRQARDLCAVSAVLWRKEIVQ